MSGFLERLRRQKIDEAYRIQRDAEARIRKAEMEDRVRQRNLQLSTQALASSIVPDYAQQLSELHSDQSYTRDMGFGDLDIVLESSPGSWENKIQIRGQFDGSVMVGETRLGANDKNNPRKVEKALEKAYLHPVYEDIDRES